MFSRSAASAGLDGRAPQQPVTGVQSEVLTIMRNEGIGHPTALPRWGNSRAELPFPATQPVEALG
jgi:hypothetical protein